MMNNTSGAGFGMGWQALRVWSIRIYQANIQPLLFHAFNAT
jgi:hypothetical protein